MSRQSKYEQNDIPLYYQIYKALKQNITDGIYKVGSSLPSESELIKKFKVSRITVRRALADLETDGYIVRQKGKGSIILRMKLERPLTVFNSFTGDALSRGDKPSSIILQLTKQSAGVLVAEKLSIEPTNDIYFLSRLRLLNGRMVAIHRSYIRSDLGFVIKDKDFTSDTSLYAFLEEKGIELGSADETVEARLANTEVKRYLFIDDVARAVIYKERTTYDRLMKPVEFSENVYLGDQYKYSVHIVNVKGGEK